MRTRQGETICLGEWIRPASTDFPPAGGVWGGMRAGFGTDSKNFSAGILQSSLFTFFNFWCSIVVIERKYNLIL